MKTSSKAVLFTKEDCAPCLNTKAYIKKELDETLVYDHLVVMKKENHSALVEAYELTLFPTLLIVDKKGEEITRVVGGNKIQAQLEYILEGIREANS
jgi:thioredoxin-related protein